MLELKDGGVVHEVTWKVIDRAIPFSPVTGICALCPLEKYYILSKPNLGSINKRDKISTGYRHISSMLLDKTWDLVELFILFILIQCATSCHISDDWDSHCEHSMKQSVINGNIN